VLTGHEALRHALVGARVRAAWSAQSPARAGGAALPRMEELFGQAGRLGAITHRPAVNEAIASSLALGGALLAGHPTCLLLRSAGVEVALPVLTTFGAINELRSASLIIEGCDAVSPAVDLARDTRATLARTAHLPIGEAASADELYYTARILGLASRKAGLPMVLRVFPEALDVRADISELGPEAPEGALTFARAAGPYVQGAAAWRFHADKRARRLRQLQPLAEALAFRTHGSRSDRAVVVAGHLGARAQLEAQARQLPAIRLGLAWPLPRQALIELVRDRQEVLVLEHGGPFLLRELALLCHEEGLACRVRGAEDALTRPDDGKLAGDRLDGERLARVLTRFGGERRSEAQPAMRERAAWISAAETAGGLSPDDAEPWPLFIARTRAKLIGLASDDPRAALCAAIRQIDRPTLVVADPGAAGAQVLRDHLIDVRMGTGSAAPIAGALSDADELEERGGAPLAVALLSDGGLYHSELAGVIDNVIARREVLHVVVASRRALPDDALEAQLRAVGLHVSTARLEDPALPQAVAYAAARLGPRALICYASAALADDGDG
jgi:TPP-dependent indolepyruvate ferredoxin oxidoreductase alpha subunit